MPVKTDAAALAPAALKDAELALSKSTLFQALSSAGRARLTQQGAAYALPAGNQLFGRGEPGDALYIVLEGEMEVRRVSKAGREVRLAALGPGAVIGEMAVLDGGPRSADVVALRRTKLLRISRALALRALEEEPKAALALVAEMSARLRAADAEIEDVHLLDLSARLAQLLIAEAGHGAIAALSQTEMARRISASREKVNRKLHDWSAAGIISLTKAGVRIEERNGLQALVREKR
jgi:CRP-like cAMP-binding protein